MTLEETVGFALDGPDHGHSLQMRPYLSADAGELLKERWPFLHVVHRSSALSVIGLSSGDVGFVENALLDHLRAASEMYRRDSGIDFAWHCAAVTKGIQTLAGLSVEDSAEAMELLKAMSEAQYWEAEGGGDYAVAYGQGPLAHSVKLRELVAEAKERPHEAFWPAAYSEEFIVEFARENKGRWRREGRRFMAGKYEDIAREWVGVAGLRAAALEAEEK